MASNEVDDAVGESPTRDPLQVLEAKRQELARAEQKAREAQHAMDLDAEVLARQRVQILREHVQRAEADAIPVREAQGEREAQAWLDQQHQTLGKVGERIAKVQDRARKLVEELVAVIQEEAALRSQVTTGQVAQEFLTMRWPALANGNGKAATLPAYADYETPILQAVQDLLPRRGLRISGLVPTQASDTPETLRKKVLKTLSEFLTHPHNVRALGKEVEGIVTRAGIPPWETPEEKAERESRAARHRQEGATIGGRLGGATN